MTAGFSLRKIKNSVTLGARFKRARKKIKMELIDIEMQIKIRSKYLSALENDDYQNLPADAYAKGFVIRYAKFLGINEQKALNDYFQQKSQFQMHKEDILSPNRSYREYKYIITPKMFTPLAVGLLIVGLFSYLSVQIYGFAAAPELSLNTPNNNSIVESDNIEVRGTTSQQAEVYINEQKIQVNSEGTFATDYKLLPGINVIRVRSVNKANKEKSLTYTVEYKSNTAKANSSATNR